MIMDELAAITETGYLPDLPFVGEFLYIKKHLGDVLKWCPNENRTCNSKLTMLAFCH